MAALRPRDRARKVPDPGGDPRGGYNYRATQGEHVVHHPQSGRERVVSMRRSASSVDRIAGGKPWFPDRQLSAGLLSLALHLLLVVSLAASLRYAPRGVAVEPDRTTGIVLVDRSQGEEQFLTAEDPPAEAALAPQGDRTDSPFPSAKELTVDVGELLPSFSDTGAAAETATAAVRADELGGGTAASLDLGGQTRTGVFGVYGEGNRFVYVFDHSGSMGGFGGRPLRAAKSELAKSLGDLDRIHQFQIIFYNERPSVFNPDGGRATLQWGDEATKRLALAFLDGIAAAGGTSHMAALRVALGMKPDVVFFLTDADEPSLSATDLAHPENEQRHGDLCRGIRLWPAAKSQQLSGTIGGTKWGAACVCRHFPAARWAIGKAMPVRRP